MAAIQTAPTAIDKKLHRILVNTDADKFTTMSAMARFVADAEYKEFSYNRGDDTLYASAETIYRYISYAKTIGLLDDNLSSRRPINDIRSIDGFQPWLSGAVMRFLDGNKCSVDKIRDATQGLLKRFPAQLPTPANVRTQLKNPLPADVFRMSLRIVSLLRPRTLQVKSRQIILIPSSVEE